MALSLWRSWSLTSREPQTPEKCHKVLKVCLKLNFWEESFSPLDLNELPACRLKACSQCRPEKGSWPQILMCSKAWDLRRRTATAGLVQKQQQEALTIRNPVVKESALRFLKLWIKLPLLPPSELYSCPTGLLWGKVKIRSRWWARKLVSQQGKASHGLCDQPGALDWTRSCSSRKDLFRAMASDREQLSLWLS